MDNEVKENNLPTGKVSSLLTCYTTEKMKCPRCGNDDLDCDKIDNGVAILQGPYGCGRCGWSEYEEYDCSAGVIIRDGYWVDPLGGGTPCTSKK